MSKQVRGELNVYEKADEEEICMGCVWKNNGCCVVWKYRSPAICKALKERLKKHKSKSIPTPDFTMTIPIKILAEWNYITGHKAFDYFILKSKCTITGWHRISTRRITLLGYNRILKRIEREERKAEASKKSVPPVNPWKEVKK